MTRQVYWLVMNMVLVVSFTIPLYLHMQDIIPGIALPFSNLVNSAVTQDIWLLTITSSTLLAAGVSSFAIYMLIIEPILKVREGVNNIQRWDGYSVVSLFYKGQHCSGEASGAGFEKVKVYFLTLIF